MRRLRVIRGLLLGGVEACQVKFGEWKGIVKDAANCEMISINWGGGVGVGFGRVRVI
jgi:hypothetical protein